LEQVHLPLWVEYTKALGAPIVALIAGCIAGGIAYQQWKTARDKLKLDLFDRRMAVYNSATTMINAMTTSPPIASELVQRLALDFVPSPWLLSSEVADYLANLVDRAYRNAGSGYVRAVGLTEEQQMMEGFQSVQNKRANLDKELRKLNSLFEQYLKVKH
jgi:hypothetical protein